MQTDKAIEIKISGMACAGCSGAVEKALSGLEGVSSAKVDLAKKTAYVNYNPAKVSIDGLKKAVEDAGYRVV
ncbi:MAG TPA: heavy metal-associated domain-containing protein [Methanothrix sp.]|nr:heavy metal-associated domain-containing protein [Methanothrix sp.]